MLRKTARIVALSFLLSQSMSYSFGPAVPALFYLAKAVVAVVMTHKVAAVTVATGGVAAGTYETVKRIFRWFNSNNNEHQE